MNIIRTAAARYLVAAAFAILAASAALAVELPRHHFATLPAPKVLYVAQSPNSEALAERWRAVLPADVTFAPLEYGHLELHHLCDKPLEESKEDVAYVTEQGKAWVDACLAKLDQFDVVIAQFPPKPGNAAEKEWFTSIQQRIVDRLRNGGNLIFINPSWEITFDATPLADVLPVTFDGKRKAWTACPGTAADHPLVRGLPLEILGTHWYGPIYNPADDTCVSLTVNKDAAAFWYRKLPDAGGQAVHLYQAYGGKWQWSSGTNYDTYEPERPDDTAMWDALFHRLVYGLTYGDKAFPVLVKVALPDGFTVRSGDKLEVPVDVENRSAEEQTALIRVSVNHRRSQVRVASSLDVTLQPRERKTIVLPVLTDSIPRTDRYLIVTAQAIEPPAGAGKPGSTDGLVLSESTKWVPFRHAVPIQLRLSKPACKPGERILLSVVGNALPRTKDYDIAVYLNDHTGRALQVTRELGWWRVDEADVLSASLVMPDRGPHCASSYWVTGVVSKDGNVVGTSRTQVQLDKPWSMREQFQWSLWSSGGDARTVALYKDAGFNALGMQGNSAVADRFGLWQYVEGTGINTFGVEINHDNWGAVRQWMVDTVDKQQQQGGPDSRSKSLVSLGEESGFKGGWGMRYYWDEPQAPPLVQKVFDDYLGERYAGKIDALNAEWGTQHKSFADIPLEKAKVRAPAQVFMTAQAWEGAQKKPEIRFPVETKKPDPARKYIANSAPYYETNNFFDWYYQKYCDLATDVYRTRRNATPLTIMSAPGGFYPKVDVYNFAGLGPFYPKEAALVGNAIARRDYGGLPGFSAAMWAYFDLWPLWNCTVMSSIIAGNTHVDYWVDVPLTFNADGTHTRASTWTKSLRRQLEAIEPLLLHKQFAYTKGLGMFIPPQPVPKGIAGGHFNSAIDCNAPIYSALEESGYMPKVVHANQLGEIKVLIASHAQVVSADEGRRLAEFVKTGGTLIVTPWLASCSPHGNLLSVYPSAESGLADLLGFRLLNTSQEVVREDVEFNGLPLVSKGRDAVIEPAADVRVLAKYKDATPLILTRAAGKGKVVYLNMIYDWDGWWNSFHEPAREAYRKLITGFVGEVVKPEYSIAFESAEPSDDNKGWWGMAMKTKPEPGESIPWWSSQLYSDLSGTVKYLGIFADHRSPAITASVKWNDPKARIFDLLSGSEIAAEDGLAKLTLRPGGAAFWAFTQDAPSRITIDAPGKLEAGKPAKLDIRLRGVNRDATHGVVVLVRGRFGELSDAHSVRNLSFRGDRCRIEIPTALNDRPGPYTVTVVDCIARKRADARFTLTAPKAPPQMQVLQPFPPRASESLPAPAMTAEQLIGELRKLRAIYEGAYAGLEAKYMLSYHLNVPFRPDNRHAIMRRIRQIDPWPHMKVLIDAIRTGERFLLLRDDEYGLNGDRLLNPTAELRSAPFTEAVAWVDGARRTSTKIDGVQFTVITIGTGAMIIAGTDVTAYHSSDFVAWHEKLKAALAQIKAGQQAP